MHGQTLTSLDGVRLRMLHSDPDPRRRTLVVALPVGTRGSFLATPLAELKSVFNVVTWESRCILEEADEEGALPSLAPAAHVSDFELILDHLELETVSLLGYCSGAALALHLAAATKRVDRLVLVNGAYFLAPCEASQTQYERDTTSLVSLVAGSLERAAAIHRDYFSTRRTKRDDHEFAREALLAYRSARSLHRFALTLRELTENSSLLPAGEIGVPTWVYSSVQDEHAHCSSSKRIAGALRRAVTRISDAGDHYELCRGRRAILDGIVEFLSRDGGTVFAEVCGHG